MICLCIYAEQVTILFISIWEAERKYIFGHLQFLLSKLSLALMMESIKKISPWLSFTSELYKLVIFL